MHKLVERYSLMCTECTENNYSTFAGKDANVVFASDKINVVTNSAFQETTYLLFVRN